MSKFITLDNLKTFLFKLNQEKADKVNPVFTGMGTYNGSEIATVDSIPDPEALTEEDILEVFSEITEIGNMEDGSF